MKKISARVLQKLKRVERMQRDVKRLVAEVEAVCEIEAVVDDATWTWAMHVDKQGPVLSADESARLLQDFIARKPA